MAILVQKKSSRPKKEASLTDIKEKINKSKSLVMTDYRGLSMVKLSELRTTLGDSAEYTVTKNTILARALKEAGLNYVNADSFAGPTAVLFSYEDEVGPIKVLTKFAVSSQDLPMIKCGVVEMALLDASRVKHLASLPGKQELRGQVVSGFAAPLSGLVSVMNGNIKNLVYALNAIKDQKAA